MQIRALLLFAFCGLAGPALANETWDCKFQEAGPMSKVRYMLHDNLLENATAPYDLYQVLENNSVAIVSVSAEAGDPKDVGLTIPDPYLIQIDTLLINRKTGEAVRGFVSPYRSPEESRPTRGKCVRE